MTAYAALPTLKTFLNITDTANDDILRLLLDTASRMVDNHCNRHFYMVTDTKYFSAEAEVRYDLSRLLAQKVEVKTRLWVPDLVSVITIKWDDDGDAVYEVALVPTDYILWPWQGYPKAAIDLDLRQGGYSSWPQGQKAIEVAGVWGYDTAIPDPVAQATMLTAARLWKRKDTSFATVIASPEMGGFEVYRGLDPDVKLMLAPYVKSKPYLGAI